jgi:hypothetical protein
MSVNGDYKVSAGEYPEGMIKLSEIKESLEVESSVNSFYRYAVQPGAQQGEWSVEQYLGGRVSILDDGTVVLGSFDEDDEKRPGKAENPTYHRIEDVEHVPNASRFAGVELSDNALANIYSLMDSETRKSMACVHRDSSSIAPRVLLTANNRQTVRISSAQQLRDLLAQEALQDNSDGKRKIVVEKRKIVLDLSKDERYELDPEELEIAANRCDIRGLIFGDGFAERAMLLYRDFFWEQFSNSRCKFFV